MNEVNEVEHPDLFLSHEHMKRLGISHLPHGTEIRLEAHGKVEGEGTETHAGETRHHMRIRLHKAKVHKNKMKKRPGEALYGKDESPLDGT